MKIGRTISLLIAAAVATSADAVTPEADTVSTSPQLLWSVDFNAVLHNREGGDEMRKHQTMLFTHLTPQVGLQVGRHSVRGGVTWYQPMLNDLGGYKVVPTAYYQYDGKILDVAVGMIPATMELPLYLRSDSINFEQPVTRGIVLNYRTAKHRFDAWLDWRQLQTKTRRESFLVGFRYDYTHKWLNPGLIVEYDHLAKSADPQEFQGVIDHLVVAPRLGLTFQNVEAGVGMLMSLNRDRHLSRRRWDCRPGFTADVSYSWRWLTVKERFYAGKVQLPYYENYGNELYWGDTWYHNKMYSRTDAIATIFRTDYVNLSLQLTFHASDKCVAFWQQLSARFYFDNRLWKSHRRADGTSGPLLNPRF